jgi:hypothetical protein
MKFDLIKRLVEAQDEKKKVGKKVDDTKDVAKSTNTKPDDSEKNQGLDTKDRGNAQPSESTEKKKGEGKSVFDPKTDDSKQKDKADNAKAGKSERNGKLAQADQERNDDGTLKTEIPPNGMTLTGEPANAIDLDPKTTSNLGESTGATAVVTFGRMNPPTIGHEHLVDQIIAIAKKLKATPLVFLSRTEDKNKNPIPYLKKLQFARRAFGNIVQPTPKDGSSIFGILKHLEGTYTDIVLVVGSDRVAELEGKVAKSGHTLNFKSIKVRSAGERDPDADGAKGASASNLRKLAQKGEAEAFELGLPSKLRGISKQVMNAVRLEEGLGVPELNSKYLLEMIDFNSQNRTVADYQLSESEVRAIHEKADESGFPVDVLETAYKRGVHTWTLTETILDHQQFAFNRVNALLNGGSNLDDDLFEGFTGDIQVPLQIAQPDRADTKQMNKTDVKPGKVKKVQVIRKIIEQVIHEDSVPGIKDGSGVSRIHMPQINNFDAFTKDLEAHGTPMGEPKAHKPSSLTPLQKHFNQDKVDTLKKSKDSKPIIISSDKKIIDGHHRYVAAHQEGSDVQARTVGMKHDDLLKFLKGKSYVGSKKLNEDVYVRATHHKAVAKSFHKDSKEYHTHMSSHHELTGEWHRANGRLGAADRSFARANLHAEAARAA